MGTFTFEWDEHKNILNQLKHKIAFEEAMTVFYDVNAVSLMTLNIHLMRKDFSLLGFLKKRNYVL